MKQLTGSLLLLCLGIPLVAGEVDQKQRVKEQSQAMADAFRTGDIEKFVSYLNPIIVKKLAGSRDKMVAKVKAFMQNTKEKGAEVKSYRITTPRDIVGNGDKRFAVVPYTMVISLPRKQYTQRAVLVATSEDGGKSWTFLDANGRSVEDMRALLPNLPKELKLPPPQAPIIEEAK